jgi:hypothetical protein
MGGQVSLLRQDAGYEGSLVSPSLKSQKGEHMREIKDFNDLHRAMQDKALRELIALAVIVIVAALALWSSHA